ncbi:efflux transporter, RND family, MFP subunit [Alkaliphilus metalliredigens QYMF]|uniref:Efflux transporter, RND family, MFP subunit n=1 Tax=Alkaliphilus metalliredigens (strain QYMF) TaxID=293826 RepID=A6TJQ6_ALKMQ|nr:efflux RND transporter periplasmic adaptor subunit [Alkaliphilus metalliredigens]ABR46424.1 efflux transporter, RND family, MFP subunit [Alkaliphilus metalliredigens QYMF]
MTKKVIYFLLLTLLLTTVLVGCSGEEEATTILEEEAYVPVEVERAETKYIGNGVNLNGKIHANDEAMVLPKIPGRVTSVNVKLGDFVQKDSVLFTIDQKDVLRSIEQAEQSVNLAQRSVEQAENAVETTKISFETTKENIENAEINLQRTKELFDAGAASRSQLEQAELAASRRPLETVENQIRQAEIGYQQALNQLSQAQIGYRQAQDALEDTVVRAPMSGVISILNVVAGELAGGTQPLATIADINRVYFQVDVTENIVNMLGDGQEVVVNIPAALEGEIIGTIDFISSTANPNTRLYTVKVNIDNQERKIRTGMSGSMDLDLDGRDNVLVINSRAVLNQEGEDIVFVVEEDHAIERQVVLGMNTGAEVEIVEGLREGESVIVKGQQYVVDGERVKIVGGE